MEIVVDARASGLDGMGELRGVTWLPRPALARKVATGFAAAKQPGYFGKNVNRVS
jgi:hypothetical protein